MERRDLLAGTAAVIALGATLADSPQARTTRRVGGLPAAADLA
jgi:hypothetical protein